MIYYQFFEERIMHHFTIFDPPKDCYIENIFMGSTSQAWIMRHFAIIPMRLIVNYDNDIKIILL